MRLAATSALDMLRIAGLFTLLAIAIIAMIVELVLVMSGGVWAR